MRRRACMALIVAAAAGAQAANAAGIRSPIPVAVRARLDVRVLATESSGEWNVTTRSPGDESRFMADLTAGNATTGIFYIKGASTWRDADDALGRVEFRADQGDYTHGFTWADSARADLVLFGDERRFFTHEMGTAVVDEDVADNFEHRIGARADASMSAVRATYWIAGLDTGDDRRANQYASLRFAPSPVFAGVSYLHDNPESGDNRAVAKAELATYFRGATGLVSFEESGTGTGLASPSGDWGGFDDGYDDAAPASSATFAELRTRRTRVGEDNLFDASYLYGTVGDDYSNDLSRLVPGSTTHRAWVDWAHRRYALDARLSAERLEQSLLEHSLRRRIDLTARARTLDNAEWLARGGVERDRFESTDEETAGFAHLAYTRELREFLGGVHVLVDDIGADARVAAGAELRLNVSATGAVSGRWIIADESGASDAFWLRLEFRPTRRTWVTAAYGRETRGDDAYFLEDRDAPPSSEAGNAITFTVRGDL